MNEPSLENVDLQAPALSEKEAREARILIDKMIHNIETVIQGKHEKVSLIVLCLLAGGHVLIEDVPGVGKTSLVSALAKTIDCNYKRVQFTPDIMPSDVTGFSIYNQKTQEFEFRPGAAMSNLVLADEINRASAKTQSALLEVMEERQVTVDLHTYKLEAPFMVLATQNPVETLGTYPLPEAQIDRFMIRLSLGYPDFANEYEILTKGKQAKQNISYVTNREEVIGLSALSEKVLVSKQVTAYILHIVRSTREHKDVRLGCSPRGSIALYAMAQAYALSQGRNYVLPDDVKYLAPYVLAHRMILNHGAKTKKIQPENVIEEIMDHVMVPTM